METIGFENKTLYGISQRMSAHEAQPMEASKTHTIEQGDEASTEFSPNLIE